MTVLQAAKSGWKFQPEIKYNVNGKPYIVALPKDATKAVTIYPATALKDTVSGATSVKELANIELHKLSDGGYTLCVPTNTMMGAELFD